LDLSEQVQGLMLVSQEMKTDQVDQVQLIQITQLLKVVEPVWMV